MTIAGGALPGEKVPLSGIPKQAVMASVQLNLMSHIYTVQEMLPLIRNGGSVTLVSSINAVRGFGLPVYSAAKAGIVGFMNGATDELANKGVRINTILPGTVPSPRTRALHTPESFERLERTTSLGRLGTSEEIADAIYFMANATWMTGSTLIYDGGQTTSARVY